jgi:hypothetical protein
MPSEVYFDENDSSIIWARLYDSASWEEYQLMNEAVMAKAHSVNHRVDNIILVECAPPKDNPLPHLQRAARLRSQAKNLGVVAVIYVTSSFSFMKMMGDMVEKIRKPSEHDPKVYFTYSLEDAFAMIKEHRAGAALV